ncbi:MAG: ARMT1-like domain-containing protein [Kiritimatiellae bacterium]|nr:ARMT1-like domain-containing protein [Kiritimatiellia bacterium]
MKTVIECIPCFARQAAEAVEQTVSDPVRREALLRRLLKAIAEEPWNGTPPVMAQRIHRLIRYELGSEDPYRDLKARMNQTAESLIPNLRKLLAGHEDRRETAVKLAIAGNRLDAGAKTQIGPDELPGHMADILSTPLRGDPKRLFKAAKEAHCILYLADNAGEIFFDRLLIEELPAEKITLFVRGAPVINDATLEDADSAGLPEILPVFGNGSDAPGTIVDDCDDKFREWFDCADLIIAKGQGNYETLSDTSRHIFFLFTVKCPVIAKQVGEPVGSMMVLERNGNE